MVPEHDPIDISKSVLHALACSTATESPLLVVMILLAREGSPWRTHSILSHSIITIVAHLTPNQLKFIPVGEHMNTNIDMTLLRATNHPIDVVVIANMEGRKAYLHPPASTIYSSPASYKHTKIQLKQ